MNNISKIKNGNEVKYIADATARDFLGKTASINGSLTVDFNAKDLNVVNEITSKNAKVSETINSEKTKTKKIAISNLDSSNETTFGEITYDISETNVNKIIFKYGKINDNFLEISKSYIDLSAYPLKFKMNSDGTFSLKNNDNSIISFNNSKLSICSPTEIITSNNGTKFEITNDNIKITKSGNTLIFSDNTYTLNGKDVLVESKADSTYAKLTNTNQNITAYQLDSQTLNVTENFVMSESCKIESLSEGYLYYDSTSNSLQTHTDVATANNPTFSGIVTLNYNTLNFIGLEGEGFLKYNNGKISLDTNEYVSKSEDTTFAGIITFSDEVKMSTLSVGLLKVDSEGNVSSDTTEYITSTDFSSKDVIFGQDKCIITGLNSNGNLYYSYGESNGALSIVSLENYASKDSPTFTGNTTLPSDTKIDIEEGFVYFEKGVMKSSDDPKTYRLYFSSYYDWVRYGSHPYLEYITLTSVVTMTENVDSIDFTTAYKGNSGFAVVALKINIPSNMIGKSFNVYCDYEMRTAQSTHTTHSTFGDDGCVYLIKSASEEINSIFSSGNKEQLGEKISSTEFTYKSFEKTEMITDKYIYLVFVMGTVNLQSQGYTLVKVRNFCIVK